METRSYSELKNLIVSRHTYTVQCQTWQRVLLTEWKDAESDVWLRPHNDDSELKMFHDMKITYQSGKGNNHLLPVVIPADLIKAMKILSDISVREMSGIRSNNIYMFPSAQYDSHVSGSHSVNCVCVTAHTDHPDRMTATKMTHRVSTLYAGVGEEESSVIRRRKLVARTSWSVEELHLVMTAFGKNIAACKVPGYGAVKSLQEKYPMLRQRSREQIKARVWHEIKKKRRNE